MSDAKSIQKWQYFSVLVAIWCLISGSIFAEDRVIPNPEAQLAESIANHYRHLRMGDEVINLSVDQPNFFALYQESRTAIAQGGTLLIHDQAQSMDWPIMVQEVRTYLPDVGWNTLSIAMPKRPDQIIPERKNPPLPEPSSWQADMIDIAHSRIREGIAELNRRGILNITLIGYGSGAHWAANYMATQLTEVDNTGYSLIIIDSRPAQNTPELDLASDLAALTIPILDVHFSQTNFEIQQAKLRRGAVLRAQYDNFTQVREAKLNSEFASAPGRVTRRIWGWLKQNVPGTTVEVSMK